MADVIERGSYLDKIGTGTVIDLIKKIADSKADLEDLDTVQEKIETILEDYITKQTAQGMFLEKVTYYSVIQSTVDEDWRGHAQYGVFKHSDDEKYNYISFKKGSLKIEIGPSTKTTTSENNTVILTGVKDPNNSYDAVNKKYADETFLKLSGGVMSGPIDMNGFNINNIYSLRFENREPPSAILDNFGPTGFSGISAVGARRSEGAVGYDSIGEFKFLGSGYNVPIVIGEPTAVSHATTKSYVDKAIASALADAGITIKIVTELPETGEEKVLYFLELNTEDEMPMAYSSIIPSQPSFTENIFEEYMWINEKWELIGSTKIDLDSYWSKAVLRPITTDELDAILV